MTIDVDKADLLEVVFEHYDMVLPSSKRKILCPVHSEDRPSAVCDPESGRWHCFACQERGDGFDIIRHKENVSFQDAVKIAEGLLNAGGREVRGNAPRQSGSRVSRGSRYSSGGSPYVPSWLRQAQ